MKPFVHAGNAVAVAGIALAWAGTRFVMRARIRGGGVDCVNLGAGILEDAGFPGDFSELPVYRADSGKHATRSALCEWFEARPDFARVDRSVLQAGDMVLFETGRVAHHMGVMINRDGFVHAMIRLGVREGTLRDSTFAERFVAAFRPMVQG